MSIASHCNHRCGVAMPGIASLACGDVPCKGTWHISGDLFWKAGKTWDWWSFLSEIKKYFSGLKLAGQSDGEVAAPFQPTLIGTPCAMRIIVLFACISPSFFLTQTFGKQPITRQIRRAHTRRHRRNHHSNRPACTHFRNYRCPVCNINRLRLCPPCLYMSWLTLVRKVLLTRSPLLSAHSVVP
jgi:hypothetical protein